MPRARRGRTNSSSGSAELDLFAAAGVEPPAFVLPGALPPHPSDFAEPHPPDIAGHPRRAAEPPVPGETPLAALGVGSLVRVAKEVLDGAFFPLWVRGEVSDFKAHRNGHWYFCLRDESSQLRCVVWSRDRARVAAPPDDGTQVVARGRLTVYEARGEMQFVVSAMDAVGDGLWRRALEEARARLAADGLLAPERKRALPRFPRRVAVVTSPDGAALRDILAVVRRRCPVVALVLVPAKVQGDGAPAEIAAAVERAGRWRDADTLIVGRGGGAREDLWAFNDERVARAVAASPIPTISAVGHEIDTTLCDLVADLRAATPSAAAEAAVPVLDDLRAELEGLGAALVARMQRGLADGRRTLSLAGRGLAVAVERASERRRARLEALAGRLNALSPLAVLSRGYALARDAEGHTLSGVASFGAGMPFELLLRDGTLRATVDNVTPTVASRPTDTL